jgi:pimeloyl-ACP methyl ester carboxylesterase
MPQDEVNKLVYHDPDRMKIDTSKLSDDELALMFRNRETLALLVWEPWMHNPKLKHRLHRATMPTLFVRGESDGLVSADYVAGYAKLLPKSRTVTIPAAGHAPQQEQPQALVKAVLEFLDG